MSGVTEEAINIALIAYHRTRPHEGAVVAMRAALAAVAPLIAAQERERVAKWHDRQTEEATARAEDAQTRGETGNVLHHARFAHAHLLSAAAIRAMGNADE